MDEATKKQWQVTSTRLIISIGKQLHIKKEDQIIMMMYLNTPKRIKMFSDWVKSKMENNKVNSTLEEVMQAANIIANGRMPDF